MRHPPRDVADTDVGLDDESSSRGAAQYDSLGAEEYRE